MFLWNYSLLQLKGPSFTKLCNPKYLCIITVSFFFNFTYLFLDRGEGREKERERNINVWLPLSYPRLGTWLATQEWVGNPMLGLQGIEVVTSWFTGWHSIH